MIDADSPECEPLYLVSKLLNCQISVSVSNYTDTLSWHKYWSWEASYLNNAALLHGISIEICTRLCCSFFVLFCCGYVTANPWDTLAIFCWDATPTLKHWWDWNDYRISPWMLNRIWLSDFEANFSDWWLKCRLWNCPHMNATRPYWS